MLLTDDQWHHDFADKSGPEFDNIQFTLMISHCHQYSFSRLHFLVHLLMIMINMTLALGSNDYWRYITKMLTKASAHVRESGFWNPWNFCLWNLESWALECGIKLNESAMLLRIGIQSNVPLEKSGIRCLESGIHGVESRIQDCLGFPYMKRKAAHVKNCCLRIYYMLLRSISLKLLWLH